MFTYFSLDIPNYLAFGPDLQHKEMCLSDFLDAVQVPSENWLNAISYEFSGNSQLDHMVSAPTFVRYVVNKKIMFQ